MLLIQSIQQSAVVGGDIVILNTSYGKKQEVKQQCCPLLVCQTCAVYKGEKNDKSTGGIISRPDYRKSSISNDKKNRRPGQKGRNASRRTDTVLRLGKEDDRCGFSLSVYQN